MMRAGSQELIRENFTLYMIYNSTRVSAGLKTTGFQFVYKELWSKLADMWADSWGLWEAVLNAVKMETEVEIPHPPHCFLALRRES